MTRCAQDAGERSGEAAGTRGCPHPPPPGVCHREALGQVSRSLCLSEGPSRLPAPEASVPELASSGSSSPGPSTAPGGRAGTSHRSEGRSAVCLLSSEDLLASCVGEETAPPRWDLTATK